MEKIAGVYQIVNLSNNMRYIGSSNNILERFLSHKNFRIHPSDIQIYCSRKCYNKAKANKFKVKCYICKKSFFRFGSSIKNNVFCSKDCYKQKRGLKIKTNCLICDKEFFIRKSVEKLNHGKYCSRECYYDSKKNKIINQI